VLIGAISALLVAVFGSLNKRMVSHADPLTVTALGWVQAPHPEPCWRR
jgi:hypothetical protein